MSVKQEILDLLGLEKNNTGITEYQIASITEKINNFNIHFDKNKKDYHGNRGLMVLVGKRNRLISYLKRESFIRYKKLIEVLSLRK